MEITAYDWPRNISLLGGIKPFFYSITDSNSDARYWLRDTVQLVGHRDLPATGPFANQGPHLVSWPRTGFSQLPADRKL